MHSQRPLFRPRTRRLSKTLAALSALSLATACADSFRALGPTAAAAEAHANDLLETFSVRFSPSVFSPRFEKARTRLAEGALIPSRIFDDTTVWDARAIAANPTSRVLYVAGNAERNEHGDIVRYFLDLRPSATPATRIGDSRHAISLDRITNSTYRWETRVDIAAGSVTADDMGLLISTLLRAPQGRTEREVREDYMSAFPRARVAWGHGFSVDSLRVTPSAVGATSVGLVGSFRPELMRERYPKLAAYLDKYLGPAKYHFTVTDRAGANLFEIAGQNRQMSIRYRIDRDGKLTTLAGPPRAWPDTLVLKSDVSLKVKLFTVGYHDMSSTFVLSNTGHERAATVIAQKEPDWDLPLLTERLIRSPLRHPFEGEGAMFRLSIRDSAGVQSLFTRRARLDVQESAIMRFLGGLFSRLVGDLDTEVEEEEDRFLHDGFVALQADLRTLAGRWR